MSESENFAYKYEKYKNKYINLKMQTGGSITEHEKKCKLIERILSKISSNAKAIGIFYGRDDDDLIIRSFIDRLVFALKPNQWIQMSDTPFDINQLTLNKLNKLGTFSKPIDSLWMSKGDWIFSLGTNMFNKFINVIEIDYTNIKLITNNTQAIAFTKKFGCDILDPDIISCMNIRWDDVRFDYSGIALVPNIRTKFGSNPNYILSWTWSWDVSSLVLWNLNNIVSYKTIVNTNEYINIKDFSLIQLDKLISAVTDNLKKIEI